MDKIKKQNNLEELTEHYKTIYSVKYLHPTPKLPFRLHPDRDVILAQMRALYEIEVKNSGRTIIWDKSIIENINRVVTWLYLPNKRDLLLSGPFGCGKTTLLSCLKRLFFSYITEANAKTIYTKCKDERVTNNLGEVPILIIDDLGVEPANGKNYGEEYHPIVDLLLFRYAKRKNTIIATNLSLEEIEREYGSRCFDRIQETFAQIQLTNSSYRLQSD